MVGAVAGGRRASLNDRSSAPARQRRLPSERVAAIEALRRRRLSSPAIARRLGLPLSTVGTVLRRLGLGRLKELDPPAPVRRYQRQEPGELIHVDTKKLGRIAGIGHRITGRRSGMVCDWRGKMLSRLRTLVKEADPEVVEEWKWRGVPVWSHDGLICTGETYKNVVKMTFGKGAALKDPSGLFNSSLDGNTRRAIDFHEGDEIDGGVEGSRARRRDPEQVHSPKLVHGIDRREAGATGAGARDLIAALGAMRSGHSCACLDAARLKQRSKRACRRP